MGTRLAVAVFVVAMVVGGGSVVGAEPVGLQQSTTGEATEVGSNAGGPLTFQWRTTVDATDAGGKPLTPVRLICDRCGKPQRVYYEITGRIFRVS